MVLPQAKVLSKERIKIKARELASILLVKGRLQCTKADDITASERKTKRFPMRFLHKSRWSTDDFNTPELMVAPQEKASSGEMHRRMARSLSGTR
jgi:hypothetical protein